MRLSLKTKHLSTLYITAFALTSCSDTFNDRSADSAKGVSSDVGDAPYLTDSASNFAAAPWPSPDPQGFLAQSCPPANGGPCASDTIAAVTAVDLISRALHSHASIALADAVNTVIALAAQHPSSKLLAIEAQILQCAKRVAAPEYSAALSIYNQHRGSIMSMPEGRRRFLREQGISIPNADTAYGNLQAMDLKAALDAFGIRSLPQASGQLDSAGKAILSEGASRCNAALIPYAYESFIAARANYPISLSIVPPANSQTLSPNVASEFRAVLVNTYDENVEWEAESMMGWFSPSNTGLKVNYSASSYILDPYSGAVTASYLNSEDGKTLLASASVRVTPPIAVTITCANDEWGAGSCASGQTFSTIDLNASVTGVSSASERNVAWSVVSGPGSIDSNGIYSAPSEVVESGVDVKVRATRIGGAQSAEFTIRLTNRSPFITFWHDQNYQDVYGPTTINVYMYAYMMGSMMGMSGLNEDVLSTLTYTLQPNLNGLSIQRTGTNFRFNIPAVSVPTTITLSASMPSGRNITATPLQLIIKPQITGMTMP